MGIFTSLNCKFWGLAFTYYRINEHVFTIVSGFSPFLFALQLAEVVFLFEYIFKKKLKQRILSVCLR